MQESLAGIYYIITFYSTIYQLYTIVLLYQLNITMPYGMLYWRSADGPLAPLAYASIRSYI